MKLLKVFGVADSKGNFVSVAGKLYFAEQCHVAGEMKNEAMHRAFPTLKDKKLKVKEAYLIIVEED